MGELPCEDEKEGSSGRLIATHLTRRGVVVVAGADRIGKTREGCVVMLRRNRARHISLGPNEVRACVNSGSQGTDVGRNRGLDVPDSALSAPCACGNVQCRATQRETAVAALLAMSLVNV